MTTLPRRSFSLTKPQLEELEREAAEAGITAAELLRRIVDDWRRRLRRRRPE